MKDFLLSVFSGAVGGLLVLLIQKFVESHESKKREITSRIINPENLLKGLPVNILKFVHIGMSVDKMKDFLGVPDRVDDKMYFELLGNDSTEITIKSYFYRFSNATMIMLSDDNQKIDAISIFNYGKTLPAIEIISFDYDPLIIGDSLFNEDFIKASTNWFFRSTSKEHYFGVENYYGRLGNYLYYTCFGQSFDSELAMAYKETEDSKLFIGEKICGVCISNREGYAPYLTMYQ